VLQGVAVFLLLVYTGCGTGCGAVHSAVRVAVCVAVCVGPNQS